MIKFFRKIRQNLLMENKTGKYFKYAIGEIILVVIGILIALQINNWNEKRIQHNQGEVLLLELTEEIIEDINTCNWAIKNLKVSIKEQEAIFKVKNLRTVDLDSLYFFFSEANVDIKIDANTKIKINNLGITSLSTNEELNNEINEYFDGSVMKFNRRIEYDWSNQRQRWKDLNEINTVNFNSDLIQGFDKMDIEETKSTIIGLINSPFFKRSILNAYYANKSTLETVLYFKEKSISLLEKIHKELLKSNPKLKPLPDFDIEQDSIKN
ncbi:hypothetical protein ESX12_16655 [Polaribacter glomeratus]|nr:hypothetical protein ESX12_16655 [Polaribacter glomeratus]